MRLRIFVMPTTHEVDVFDTPRRPCNTHYSLQKVYIYKLDACVKRRRKITRNKKVQTEREKLKWPITRKMNECGSECKFIGFSSSVQSCPQMAYLDTV